MADFHHFPLLVLFICMHRMTLQDVIWVEFFHSTWWFEMIAVVLLITLFVGFFPRASFYCLLFSFMRDNLPLPMAIVSSFSAKRNLRNECNLIVVFYAIYRSL